MTIKSFDLFFYLNITVPPVLHNTVLVNNKCPPPPYLCSLEGLLSLAVGGRTIIRTGPCNMFAWISGDFDGLKSLRLVLTSPRKILRILTNTGTVMILFTLFGDSNEPLPLINSINKFTNISVISEVNKGIIGQSAKGF